MATGIGKQIAGFDVWWGDYHLQELLDNHNENHHGKHSKWGRKKASRRAYT